MAAVLLTSSTLFRPKLSVEGGGPLGASSVLRLVLELRDLTRLPGVHAAAHQVRRV